MITVKEGRKYLGLSQPQLADKLGWSSSRHIARLETGQRVASAQTLLAIECLMRRAGWDG